MEKSVINISGKPLIKHHLYAFYLEGSSAPTQKLPNLMKFNDDLQSWFNKFRYKYNYNRFSDRINPSSDNQISSTVTKEIKNMERCLIKYQRNPNVETTVTNSPALELYIQKIKEEVGSFKHHFKISLPSNLDRETLSAINEMERYYYPPI